MTFRTGRPPVKEGKEYVIQDGDIVNLDAVAKLEPWTHGDGILVLKDGTTVVLSRTWREAFLERWGMAG